MSEQLIAEAVSYLGSSRLSVEEILADCGVRPRRPTVAPFLWTPRHPSDDVQWDKFWSDANLNQAFAGALETDNEMLDGPVQSEKGDVAPADQEVVGDSETKIEGLETEFKVELAPDRIDLLSEGLIEVDRSEEIRFEKVSTPFVKPDSVIDFVVS